MNEAKLHGKAREFFGILVQYLRALNDDVLDEDWYQNRVFMHGREVADTERVLAERGMAFLTMPNGSRQYRKIEKLGMRDMPHLMREIEYNDTIGGEHSKREPTSDPDVETYISTNPETGRVSMSPVYAKHVTPDMVDDASFAEADRLFHEVQRRWPRLKARQLRWR